MEMSLLSQWLLFESQVVNAIVHWNNEAQEDRL